jgi:hypothetical protein
MSTNFFNGYNEAKPTSKVLAPPGGRSNNIFGDYVEEEPKQRNGAAKAQQQSHIFGDVQNTNQQAQQQLTAPTQIISAQQANAKRRGGFNPITGEPYDYDKNNENENKQKEVVKQVEQAVQQQQQQQQQPTVIGAPPVTGSVASSRVSQPPGGRSTKLW